MTLPAWLLGTCLALLLALLFASPGRARAQATLLSALLLALSLWWFIDQLSGDGINAATIYHLSSGIEGAGVSDFIRPILGLAALSLLPYWVWVSYATALTFALVRRNPGLL